VPAYLPDKPKGRVVVVGAGKAAAAMAKAVEDTWGEVSGLVVTRYGHNVPCRFIEVVEASHPVPDAAGMDAARRILDSVKGLGPDDMVLALISGGGSALLALPAEGIALSDKQQVNKSLLMSGATISEMNCVRKHLSAIKGGRLAQAAYPAQVVTLTISDVPGDDPSVIASGPTVADPTTFADAVSIIAKYGIDVPPNVLAHLKAGVDETPKPGNPCFAKTELRMIVTPQAALEAAALQVVKDGYTPMILGSAIEGEARDVALVHAAIAKQVIEFGQPAAAPLVLLSGGETTVTVRGKGRGGRNTEFLLALTIALDGVAKVHAIAGDTDGIDGSEDNAGALIDPTTLARAAKEGLNPKTFLGNNDGYSFFEKLGDLVVTGPSLTNVNDFRAILIERS
jgi:hydroxypyruvate reductase